MGINDRSQALKVRLLGYAGLVPFVAGATWVCAARFGSFGSAPTAGFALAAYAATIVAFLGGVHWGTALRDGAYHLPTLAWGVLPQLAAWLALLLPMRMSLVGMGGLLAMCFLLDRRLYPRAGLERWLPLRSQLTFGGVVCCLVAAAV